MNSEKSDEMKARMIAFYLPQFHPIPENNKWWGEGFTEWTNVAKAQPLFKGHYQPHFPADLGYYDLRVEEIRIAQAQMAEDHGIEGFCYWHYWFQGKRLIERPFNEVLNSGKPNFPFCLGWANKTWSGIWTGCPGRILIEQNYPGKEDEEAHFQALVGAFFDRRYLRIDGRPIFYIYKPYEIPEPQRFLDHWRELAVKSGLKGMYFIAESNIAHMDPIKIGFDASVPHIGHGFISAKVNSTSFLERIKRSYFRRIYGLENVFSYQDFVENWCNNLSSEGLQYPCVLPNWDNTPRSGKAGYVLTKSTPELFRKQLLKALSLVHERELDKRVIFLKSWNEWAEGNYLEPDQKFGAQYLDVCRDIIFPENKG